MTAGNLLQQLKKVCEAVTHEAKDPRLTREEVFGYLKVVNSAAHICAGLDERTKRVGLEKAKDDIFRFVGVAVRRIETTRKAVERRESDP